MGEAIENYAMYVLNTKNLESEGIDLQYIKAVTNELIESISSEYTLELEIIEHEIRQVQDDIELLEASYVGSGENYDSVGGGRNNGLIPNTVEMKHIEVIKLKEKLGQLVVRRILERDKLKERASLFVNVLKEIPRKYGMALYMMYIEKAPYSQIAEKLIITEARVRSTRTDAVAIISKETLKFIQKYTAPLDIEHNER